MCKQRASLELPQGEVHVHPDAETLATAATGEFVRLAGEAIAKGGRFAVALAGGSTPRSMYSKLATMNTLSWERICFFFGDERCVPPEHPDSNYGMANAELFSRVRIPSENVHRIEAELDGYEAASRYQRTVESFFNLAGGQLPRFDLILLGMGEDGHVASLFPGTAALQEARLAVVLNHVPQLSADRITLTLPALNAASQVMFLVSGGSKAKVVSEVLGPPESSNRYPAQRVLPSAGRTVWMLDEAAASRILPPTGWHQEWRARNALKEHQGDGGAGLASLGYPTD